MPTPAPIPGPAGAAGPAGPAPSGTGLVSVTGGVLDSPSTLVDRVAADAAAIKAALGVSSFPVRLEILAGLATTTTSVGYDVLGYVTFAAADYARSGLTTTLTLEALGLVVSGVTGTLVLFDGDSESAAATLTWTETGLTPKTASVSVPTETIYQLRFSKSGGGEEEFPLLSALHLPADWR